jgi:hypothetical protein
MLSIEITRECPLSCPGCYAYGDSHLAGGKLLRDLSDFRGTALVAGVLNLVRKHRPMHVSLVGGEPLVRHRELSEILPALSAMNVFSLVVTSGVIPVPMEWMKLRRLRVAVSIDGLPEHHDVRREPATYERILQNLQGREFNPHWVISGPMLQASRLPRGVCILLERSTRREPHMGQPVHAADRRTQPGDADPGESCRRSCGTSAAGQEVPQTPRQSRRVAQAFLHPPSSPSDCLFAKMSANYSADLGTRVEPCVFGGSPDCSQCGCSVSSGLHWIRGEKVVGPLRVGHFVETSIAIGTLVNRLRRGAVRPSRWRPGATPVDRKPELVKIET